MGPTSVQNTALANTVIVFTSDHGELGGAHSLLGKSACSYDEILNVPLFVYVPGNTTNYQRNQLVSSVDFFGLIGGLASNSYVATVPPQPSWKNSNPQLSTRTDMLACLQSNSYAPTNRTISIGGVATPYIMHTYNDWFRSSYDENPWDDKEPCHVVCVRTATQKLVYYDTWDTASPPSQATYTASDFDPAGSNYASDWSTNYAEYYNLSTNPTETGNAFATSPVLDIQTAFPGCISNELQAPFTSSALTTALTNAQNAFFTYITAPSGISVTETGLVHSLSPQTFHFTGTGILPGPTATLSTPSGIAPPLLLDDTLNGPNYPVTFTLATHGPYVLTISNPSTLAASTTFHVS